MKLILGMGITGLSVARFFANNKEIFRIADSRKEPSLFQTFQKENLLLDCCLGEWNESILDGIDEVIISPGIAQSERIVQWIRKRKIKLLSDIELFGCHSNAPIIGITGSNGKSTVTQLLGDMGIASNLNAVVCGNIGSPVLECISDTADLYIVELSSYQLDYTSRLELFAGVITNISPDHLDRYDNYEAYIASKLSIYPYCKNVIINLDEPLLSDLEGDSYFSLEKNDSNCVFSARKMGSSYEVFYKEQLIITSNELLVVGRHNIENLLAALSLGFQFGMPIERMIEAAKRFKGLPHRLEFITSINEVDFYNDSKSTNAISTKSAIISLLEKYSHLVLILGGIAKQEDYSELFALIREKIDTVVLIGESTRVFSKEIASPVIKNARTMDEAVSLSKSLAKGGAILLSPACASFDMFLDFNDRGDQFKYYVTGGNQLPS